MTGVLEWKDAGSLGRAGRGDKDRVSPAMSVTSWSAWSSTWGWMRSPLWVRSKGQGQVTLEWRSATGHPTRKTKQIRQSVVK